MWSCSVFTMPDGRSKEVSGESTTRRKRQIRGGQEPVPGNRYDQSQINGRLARVSTGQTVSGWPGVRGAWIRERLCCSHRSSALQRNPPAHCACRHHVQDLSATGELVPPLRSDTAGCGTILSVLGDLVFLRSTADLPALFPLRLCVLGSGRKAKSQPGRNSEPWPGKERRRVFAEGVMVTHFSKQASRGGWAGSRQPARSSWVATRRYGSRCTRARTASHNASGRQKRRGKQRASAFGKMKFADLTIACGCVCNRAFQGGQKQRD